MHKYKPRGVCAKEISFELRDGKVYSVSFTDGCDGNLKAIGILVEGMETAAVIQKLKGVRCGQKNTSCADQLAAALEQGASV